MKKLLVLIFLFISISSFSQKQYDDVYYQSTTKENLTAGDELIKYTNHYYTSYVVGISGGIIFSLGYNTKYSSVTNIVGGLLMLTGAILQIESHSHIKKAGKILNKSVSFKPVNSGLALLF